jgi:hypothetical protein
LIYSSWLVIGMTVKVKLCFDSRKVVVEIPHPLRSDNLLTCLVSLTRASLPWWQSIVDRTVWQQPRGHLLAACHCRLIRWTCLSTWVVRGESQINSRPATCSKKAFNIDLLLWLLFWLSDLKVKSACVDSRKVVDNWKMSPHPLRKWKFTYLPNEPWNFHLHDNQIFQTPDEG